MNQPPLKRRPSISAKGASASSSDPHATAPPPSPSSAGSSFSSSSSSSSSSVPSTSSPAHSLPPPPESLRGHLQQLIIECTRAIFIEVYKDRTDQNFRSVRLTFSLLKTAMEECLRRNETERAERIRCLMSALYSHWGDEVFGQLDSETPGGSHVMSCLCVCVFVCLCVCMLDLCDTVGSSARIFCAHFSYLFSFCLSILSLLLSSCALVLSLFLFL